MNREETIKWLKSLKAEIGKLEYRTLWHYAEVIDIAIEALQDEAVQRWIPCSERLPSKQGRYMVTHKAFIDMVFIDLFYYGKPLMPNRKVRGKCWYRSDDEWGDVVYEDSEIIAWMPLPEPYREDGEA